MSLTLHLVQRFAQDVIAPRVREMDENEMMDKAVIDGLFENGVRVIQWFPETLSLHSVAHGYRNIL